MLMKYFIKETYDIIKCECLLEDIERTENQLETNNNKLSRGQNKPSRYTI